MDKYTINTIVCDGHERFANVTDENGIDLNVHFLEYSEYVDNGVSQIKKKGDRIEGILSVDLVTKSKICNDDIMFKQDIESSSHIEAVVDIAEIIDEYSAYAMTAVTDKPIPIEFESKISYKVNDRIYIEGSLEIHT